ncbi:MAG: hypothetical protein ACK4FL_00815 [Microgenomates group bacterium]
MKKETIIAVIFGIFLGGLLAIIIITKNKQSQLEKNKTIAPTEKPAMVQKQSQPKFQPLEIVEPASGVIISTNKVNISAKVTKNSLVIIQSPIKDSVFKVEKDQFSVSFPLALGENVIRVAVYPQDKKLPPQEKELRVYYLKEQL